jgi:hypothetical protein
LLHAQRFVHWDKHPESGVIVRKQDFMGRVCAEATLVRKSPCLCLAGRLIGIRIRTLSILVKGFMHRARPGQTMGCIGSMVYHRRLVSEVDLGHTPHDHNFIRGYCPRQSLVSSGVAEAI